MEGAIAIVCEVVGEQLPVEKIQRPKVARWQNLIPSFPWIVPGWRAWGCNCNMRSGNLGGGI